MGQMTIILNPSSSEDLVVESVKETEADKLATEQLWAQSSLATQIKTTI